MRVAKDSFPIDADPALPGHPDPYTLLHRLRADDAAPAMAQRLKLTLDCHYVIIPYTLANANGRSKRSYCVRGVAGGGELDSEAEIPAYDGEYDADAAAHARYISSGYETMKSRGKRR